MSRIINLRIILLLAVLFVGGFIFISNQSVTAQQAIGKTWAPELQVSIDHIDHSSFNTLLQKYVDADGMVDYASWHSTAADRTTLQQYLQQLGKANTNLTATRENTLAFWINAYNAVTLEGILQVYPTTSIRKHTAKLVGYNIWKNLLLPVGNGTEKPTKISLDSMEHKVLRKMSEPRIHFAIVCASISCPRLLNEAYVGERFEQQLQTNTLDFFSRAQNLQVDAASSTLKLSSIMKWFGGDFGSSSQEQVATVAPYFPETAKRFVGSTRYRVGYLDYDWNLNAQKK